MTSVIIGHFEFVPKDSGFFRNSSQNWWRWCVPQNSAIDLFKKFQSCLNWRPRWSSLSTVPWPASICVSHSCWYLTILTIFTLASDWLISSFPWPTSSWPQYFAAVGRGVGSSLQLWSKWSPDSVKVGKLEDSSYWFNFIRSPGSRQHLHLDQ
jgi:hypothetical protein